MKKMLYIFAILLLLTLLTVRNYSILTKDSEVKNSNTQFFPDFYLYYSEAEKLIKQEPLYSHESGVPPLIFPSQAVLFTIFLPLNYKTAAVLFWIINNMAIMGVFFLLLKVYNFRIDFLETLFLFLLLLFSSPASLEIADGQIGCMVSLFILLAVLIDRPLTSGILTGIALTLKVSFLPFAGIILFTKNCRKTVFTALCVFIIMALAPMYFVPSLIDVYKEFFGAVHETLQTFNSFKSDGARDRIDLGYINIMYFNQFAICFTLFTFAYFLKERFAQGKIPLDIIFLWACLSLAVGYHRLYDAVVVNAILMMMFMVNLKNKQIACSVISFTFLFLLCVPHSIIVKYISHGLYNLSPHMMEYFLGNYEYKGELSYMFPTYAAIHTLLILYATFSFVRQKSSSDFSIDRREWLTGVTYKMKKAGL